MRTPPHNATSAAGAANMHRWITSPVPYLFGGLALMLGLIALALLILACSYKKPRNNLNSGEVEEEDEEKSCKVIRVLQPEWEPKFVVIMAGDYEPTYLAEPVLSATHHQDELHEQV